MLQFANLLITAELIDVLKRNSYNFQFILIGE